MKAKRYLQRFCIALFVGAVLPAPAQAKIEIPTVSVGDPGNPNHTDRWGSVSYEYRIGVYPVTNSQYAAFLNSVAATDSHGLYSLEMGESIHGGITRTGNEGEFTYAVKEGFGNKPVNFVSFWDAARFSNWLTNGQPTGPQGMETTESGMYFLGGVTNPNLIATARDAEAWNAGGVAVADGDEWVKAAYYDPTKSEADGYWSYPTRHDVLPSPSLPNAANANSANCDNAVGTVTDVGAYVLARSYYGTYDQGGNVWEWVEHDFPQQRGGSFENTAWSLHPTHSRGPGPTAKEATTGFRVSSLHTIPVPQSSYVELELQFSTDLQTWDNVPISSAVLTEGGKISLPTDQTNAFYRLRIKESE